MADIVFLALLFIHIVTVVLWMGSSILFVSVLAPSLAKVTPSSRVDLYKAIGPAYQRYVGSNATIAIAAGLILYAYINGNITQVSGLAPSQSGMPWILAGILFGLAAYIIGLGVVLRSNSRLLKLISQTPTGQTGIGPSGEMQALQRRIAMSSGLQAILLALSLLSMVLGSNIP